MTTSYNPLDKVNLGRSVAEAMLERAPVALSSLKRFDGAGIYALYYVGKFAAYSELAKRNANKKFEAPIYIGKAVSPGARKGNFGVEVTPGAHLYKRLQEHIESIQAAKASLDLKDFHCRFIVVDDIWIPLGEALLIAKFSPVWNKHLDGFGNHDPGKGRYEGMRPRWDVLHPGRGWAEKCAPRPESSDQITSELQAVLRSVPDHPRHMFGDGN